MTETGPLSLLLSGEMALKKVGSSGLPPLYTRLKICDPKGREVKRGETGELLIKGPNVMPGYWNRPEANAQAFTADGYFHTGDAARQDEDGYYYIVDRWKDMFISGGENVYPAEVENVIYQLDGVLETAVIGVPHEKWGEVGRACVVLKPGSNLDEEAIIGHCGTQLARYKVPKDVRFMGELPHNATGKVLKHHLPRD
jgi:fatty-acyl-CoA synthase